MDGFRWITENWVTVLNAIGVVGGLLFTAFSLRSDTTTRRIANLLTITRNHREIWGQLFTNPELGRILNTSANITSRSITREEEVFVNMVILHTSSAFQAMKSGLFIKEEGLRRDVCAFFSLPIPSVIWEKVKLLQNDDFVAFIEACRKWK